MSWCTILGPWSLQCHCGEVCGTPGCVWCVNVPRGELGLPYLVRRSSLPSSATVCAVFLCVQTMVWLPVFEIFNVRTDVDACDCTRGLCRPHERVCTGSWLWEKSPLPHLGLEPAHQYCTWLSGRMVYPLSYPTAPVCFVRIVDPVCRSTLFLKQRLK